MDLWRAMIRLGKGVGLVLQKREEAGAASAFPYSIPVGCGSGGMGAAEKETRERALRERERRRAGLGERRVIGRGKGVKLVCYHTRFGRWVRRVRPESFFTIEEPCWGYRGCKGRVG